MKKSAVVLLALSLSAVAIAWSWPATAPNAPRATLASNTSRGVCTDLLLLLRPGMRGANGKVEKLGIPVPKSMARFVIPLDLPVYPALSPDSKVPGYMQGGGYELIPDTKSAVANFSTSVVEGKVYGWYQKWMPACGFSEQSSGGGGGGGQPIVDFLGYTWKGNPDLSVNISFATVYGRTLVNFTATAPSYAARPRASYLPYGNSRVWIKYVGEHGRVEYQGLVKNLADRNAVLDAVNDTWTQVNGGGEHTCLAFGANAYLRVVGPHGHVWSVALDGSCGDAVITTKVGGHERRFAFQWLGDTLDVLNLVAIHGGQ